MSIVVSVGPNRMEVREGHIQIEALRQYRIFQEGNKTPITGYDEALKSIKLIVSNGLVDIIITTVAGNDKAYDETTFLNKFVPEGFDLIDTREAAKMIKGLKGRYYYYYNKQNKSYIALVTRGGSKPNRIALGSIDDRASTLSRVLEKLPFDKPFRKAELNNLLPAKIVENRQPIKAALDILEREGYVRKTGSKFGISEEYIRSGKAMPLIGLEAHMNLDSINPKEQG